MKFLVVAALAISLVGCTSSFSDSRATPAEVSTDVPATTSSVSTGTSVPPPSPERIGPGMTMTPSASNTTFAEDLARAGISESAGMTLQMWAGMACQMAPKMNFSDADVIAKLPGDVDGNGIILTPDQAAAVWDSAKRNVCPKSG